MGEIASTIRCPNLPAHIKAGTHDVASAFKRLLSGLPGGILGSLSLFDALVAIHGQLKGDPELPRTKQTRVRATLIAMAIRTVGSQLRRDLICAVFGLLCQIGRTAEQAPREDEHGRPLPATDLVGYNALGIIFGPLLIGDLISFYPMEIADRRASLVLLPVPLPLAGKEARKCRASEDSRPRPLSIDKVYVANNITEMVITHWREIVRQMKHLEVPKPHTGKDGHGRFAQLVQRKAEMRSSVSEPSMTGESAEWSSTRPRCGLFDGGGSHASAAPTLEARKLSCRRFVGKRLI